MTGKTIKDLAREAGITDEQMDAFEVAMAGVKGVLDGTLAKPGGPGCVFPHCACQLPWDNCEKEFKRGRPRP